MRSFKVAYFALCIVLISVYVGGSPVPRPDSAGIVEMPPGLAYGGIPYGSITGKVADYYGGKQRSLAPRGTPGQHGQPLRPVYHIRI